MVVRGEFQAFQRHVSADDLQQNRGAARARRGRARFKTGRARLGLDRQLAIDQPKGRAIVAGNGEPVGRHCRVGSPRVGGRRDGGEQVVARLNSQNPRPRGSRPPARARPARPARAPAREQRPSRSAAESSRGRRTSRSSAAPASTTDPDLVPTRPTPARSWRIPPSAAPHQRTLPARRRSDGSHTSPSGLTDRKPNPPATVNKSRTSCSGV